MSIHIFFIDFAIRILFLNSSKLTINVSSTLHIAVKKSAGLVVAEFNLVSQFILQLPYGAKELQYSEIVKS